MAFCVMSYVYVPFKLEYGYYGERGSILYIGKLFAAAYYYVTGS